MSDYSNVVNGFTWRESKETGILGWYDEYTGKREYEGGSSVGQALYELMNLREAAKRRSEEVQSDK